MSSLDSALTRQALAKGTVIHKKADEPVGLRLRYIGTGSVTDVAITTATGIIMRTSDGGTDNYAFSGAATMGILEDQINADGIFEARVLDMLRSENPDDSLLQVTLTATTYDEGYNNVFDVVIDSSGALSHGVCLSPTRYFDAPKGHRVHLQGLTYFSTLNGASADSLQIFKRKGTLESQVYGTASVTGTLTTINFASGEGKITGNPDEEFIVLVKDATSISDTGLYMTVIGEIE
jgi:hypothetical protein